MVQLLVIAMVVVIHLRDAEGSGGGSDHVAGIVLGAAGVMWLVVQAAAARAGWALDRTGDYRQVLRVERVVGLARVIVAGVLGWGIYFGGWLAWVRGTVGDLVLLDELLTLSPLLVFLVMSWWSVYPVERRVREAMLLRQLYDGSPVASPVPRGGFVLSQLRYQVLIVLVPVSLVTAWEETVPRIAAWTGWAERSWWASADAGITWAGVAVCLLVAPGVMRLVWDTVAIGPGEVRSQVRRVCDTYGVRVGGPLLWRTHGTMLNGAMVGMMWPFRYLLFTDALVERLERDELEGVIAHEVAHTKLRHPLWMGLAVLAAGILAAWTAGLAAVVVGFDVESGPWVVLGSLAFAGAVFGWVSRRFEWQADAFAARHLSVRLAGAEGGADGVRLVTEPAAGVMGRALGRVASLNGVDPRRFDFRHGSIALRRRRLEALVGQDHARLAIDRAVRWIKGLTVVVLALGAAGVALSMLGGGG